LVKKKSDHERGGGNEKLDVIACIKEAKIGS